ncbi:MAG: phosphoribosylanthranilate isomerase [Planctomycetes bacterium]|nr:phosphoribosylanthranilate isomerase [Planctomycetota bacterium]
MFRIKICGVTTVDDACAAVQLGAEMIGLNFYAKSPRYVSPEQAQVIAAEIPQTTGVFVNASAEEINGIAKSVGLDWVQLHGDEPPELLADLRSDLPIIRVRCLDERGVGAIADDLEACRTRGREPAAYLVDATVPGQYGGTGKTADWAALKNYRDWLGEIPLILAGGLIAENVAEAIAVVRPDAVDTASGVESEPGVKDAGKMQTFCEASAAAFGKEDVLP